LAYVTPSALAWNVSPAAVHALGIWIPTSRPPIRSTAALRLAVPKIVAVTVCRAGWYVIPIVRSYRYTDALNGVASSPVAAPRSHDHHCRPHVDQLRTSARQAALLDRSS
jgi:hypothetical protein